MEKFKSGDKFYNEQGRVGLEILKVVHIYNTTLCKGMSEYYYKLSGYGIDKGNVITVHTTGTKKEMLEDVFQNNLTRNEPIDPENTYIYDSVGREVGYIKSYTINILVKEEAFETYNVEGLLTPEGKQIRPSTPWLLNVTMKQLQREMAKNKLYFKKPDEPEEVMFGAGHDFYNKEGKVVGRISGVACVSSYPYPCRVVYSVDFDFGNSGSNLKDVDYLTVRHMLNVYDLTLEPPSKEYETLNRGQTFSDKEGNLRGIITVDLQLPVKIDYWEVLSLLSANELTMDPPTSSTKADEEFISDLVWETVSDWAKPEHEESLVDSLPQYIADKITAQSLDKILSDYSKDADFILNAVSLVADSHDLTDDQYSTVVNETVTILQNRSIELDHMLKKED